MKEQTPLMGFVAYQSPFYEGIIRPTKILRAKRIKQKRRKKSVGR